MWELVWLLFIPKSYLCFFLLHCSLFCDIKVTTWLALILLNSYWSSLKYSTDCVPPSVVPTRPYLSCNSRKHIELWCHFGT